MKRNLLKNRIYSLFNKFKPKSLLFSGFFLLVVLVGYGQDLSIVDVTESEDVGNMVFTVTFNGSEPLGTTVSYSFIDLPNEATGGVDYDNTGGVLNFAGLNGETQTITVAIVDDLIDEDNNEDFTVQLGTPTNGVGLAGGGDARGRIVDNDVAGVNVSPTTGTTTEAGGTATFTFTLTSEPTADVTISIDQYDATETSGASSVLLNSTNWDIGVDLIVTGVDDFIIDGDIVDNIRTNGVTSTDPFYGSLGNNDIDDLVVTNEDNDSAGYTVTPTSLNTSEGGATQNFTVVLNAEPASNVVFSVTSGDTSEGTVSPGTLTFTPGNYNVAQTVTVTPIDDPAIDGNITYDVTVSVVDGSSDNNFDPLADQTVSVTNADNDAAGYTVTPTSLNTSEGGATQNFTVVLNARTCQQCGI